MHVDTESLIFLLISLFICLGLLWQAIHTQVLILSLFIRDYLEMSIIALCIPMQVDLRSKWRTIDVIRRRHIEQWNIIALFAQRIRTTKVYLKEGPLALLKAMLALYHPCFLKHKVIFSTKHAESLSSLYWTSLEPTHCNLNAVLY